MQPMSADFTAAIPLGYRTAQQVEFFINGLKTLPTAGFDSNGNPLTIYASSASVSIDSTQPVRTTCQLTIVPTDSWVWDFSAIDAFGGEVKLWLGIAYDDGTTELIPQGVFAITSAAWSKTPTGLALSIQGSDRGYTVGLRKLMTGGTFADGSSVAAAVESLIGPVLPNGSQLIVAPAAASATLVGSFSYNYQDDPWQDAVSLVQNAGLQLYFDINGNARMETVPATTGVVSVYDFSPGEDSVVSSATQTQAQQGVSGQIGNTFIVINESATTSYQGNLPVQAQAQDTNPNSTMNASGPYGVVPVFIQPSAPLGQGEAQAEANLALALAEGQAWELSATLLVPIPALEVLDVITMNDPDLPIQGNFVVDTITVGAGPMAGMSFTARSIPPA